MQSKVAGITDSCLNMPSASTHYVHFLPLFHASYLTQQAGVDSICRELDSLRQLVHTAARAATETGVTMPSTDKAHRHTSIYRKLPSVTVLGTYISN